MAKTPIEIVNRLGISEDKYSFHNNNTISIYVTVKSHLFDTIKCFWSEINDYTDIKVYNLQYNDLWKIDITGCDEQSTSKFIKLLKLYDISGYMVVLPLNHYLGVDTQFTF